MVCIDVSELRPGKARKEEHQHPDSVDNVDSTTDHPWLMNCCLRQYATWLAFSGRHRQTRLPDVIEEKKKERQKRRGEKGRIGRTVRGLQCLDRESVRGGVEASPYRTTDSGSERTSILRRLATNNYRAKKSDIIPIVTASHCSSIT